MPPTSKRTKSLLEQIADISDPRPNDFDIENAGIADNAFLGGNSGTESDESDDEELRRKHYVNVGKSVLRRQQGIGELGPKYTGSRISRKDLYDGDELSDGSDDDDGDEEQGSDDQNEDSESAVSDSDGSEPKGLSESEDDSRLQSDEDDESGSESEGASEDDGDALMSGGVKGAAESRQRLRAEMKKLEEGEKALLSSITQTARSDVEKGQHVLNQTRLWEGALDARIRVQKLVTAANELPQFDVFEDLVGGQHTESDDEVDGESGQLAKARESVRLLLRSIIDLQTTLIEQNPSVDKAHSESQPSQKRKAATDEDGPAAWWQEIEDMRSRFKPYRNESLEKWGNKVQISANAASLKKFKAVNQGILHQINQTLAAGDRLVERTQLKRVDYNIIGKESAQSVDSEDKQSKVDAHLKDTDPEIFDDTDFYQQLLRELIESRMVDSNDPAGGLGTRWAAVNQRPQSKKRIVDTKASKGRKLRYHVLEKLQNFMPPVPAGTWHEDMVNELFSSLLGQKVPQSILDAEMEETEPRAATVTESLVQSGEIDISGQGLRLFG
ncbi:rRNA-processing protein bfr2 [Coemansia sp. RSA 2611]|nr:rRNA-processing protein bfr2 [Coemansia sp. RSA 2611]